jgi:hypothetical protein
MSDNVRRQSKVRPSKRPLHMEPIATTNNRSYP